MIRFSRHGLTFGESWFDETPPGPGSGVDILIHCQKPTEIEGKLNQEFFTILVDLSKTEEELLSGFTKENRYEIRRASARDDFSYNLLREDCADHIEQFLRFYNSFAGSVGMPQIRGNVLWAYANQSSLVLAKVCDVDGNALVWHAYFTAGKRTRLLYSASHHRDVKDSAQRARIGRANRSLHWKTLLWYKEQGFLIYDFGGWYGGTEDSAKLRINEFKEGFGGSIVREFNCRYPLTIRGKAYETIRHLYISRGLRR